MPVLDKITVSTVDGTAEMQSFSFGGQIGENPVNVSNTNIVPTLVLATGSATPKIKPVGWAEMGTPRIMTFFVPYSGFANLEDDKAYTLSVTTTTIDDETVTKQLSFSKKSSSEKSLTRFIKIANNGKELSDNAVLGNKPNDWACTKDTQTGLIWEMKTNDGGLRDDRWTYTWYDPQYLPDAYDVNGYIPGVDADADGIWSGSENPEKSHFNNGIASGTNKQFCNANPAHCNTYAYTKAVNAKGLCAASDWRMPSKDELLSISPALYYYYACCTGWFWSSSLSSLCVGHQRLCQLRRQRDKGNRSLCSARARRTAP